METRTYVVTRYARVIEESIVILPANVVDDDDIIAHAIDHGDWNILDDDTTDYEVEEQ